MGFDIRNLDDATSLREMRQWGIPVAHDAIRQAARRTQAALAANRKFVFHSEFGEIVVSHSEFGVGPQINLRAKIFVERFDNDCDSTNTHSQSVMRTLGDDSVRRSVLWRSGHLSWEFFKIAIGVPMR